MPIISLIDLHKTFYSGSRAIEVLKGVNLHVEPGETVAIVGASGVGKSTLLHILGTLDRPTRGEVLIEGRNPYTMGEGETASFRNRTIGFVFQFHHLLPEFSALENVMMPGLISRISRQESEARAESLLGELGLRERLTHRPGALSGGEQQRVALARALMRSPKVLLADEPTGNLDRKTGEGIEELLRDLNRAHGLTEVIVTHNEKLAEGMSRRFQMMDGKLANGSPSERGHP